MLEAPRDDFTITQSNAGTIYSRATSVSWWCELQSHQRELVVESSDPPVVDASWRAVFAGSLIATSIPMRHIAAALGARRQKGRSEAGPRRENFVITGDG
ncbi:MAG: hypothetical protein Kow0040_17540 [Thermogutta sp.]